MLGKINKFLENIPEFIKEIKVLNKNLERILEFEGEFKEVVEIIRDLKKMIAENPLFNYDIIKRK